MTASLQYRIQGGSINDGIEGRDFVFMLRSECFVPVLSWQDILFFKWLAAVFLFAGAQFWGFVMSKSSNLEFRDLILE
jgi:hypothetical protein